MFIPIIGKVRKVVNKKNVNPMEKTDFEMQKCANRVNQTPIVLLQ
jgi:hypothetical protein